jgi:hypothetical protein
VFIVEGQRKLGVLLEQGLVEAGYAVGYASRFRSLL